MDVKYTKWPNDIQEAIYSWRSLNKRHLLILWYIGRLTFGYHRDWAMVTLANIAENIGIKDNHISLAIKQMLSANILLKQEEHPPKLGGWHTKGPKCLRINPNTGNWKPILPKQEDAPTSQNRRENLPKQEDRPNSLPIKVIKDKRKTTIGSLAPDSFPITDQMRKWVVKNFGVVKEELLINQTELFLDTHRSKGKKFSKWESAWKTWIRRWQTDFGRNIKTPPAPIKDHTQHPNYRGS